VAFSKHSLQTNYLWHRKLKKNSKLFFNNSLIKLFVQSPPKASAGSSITHFKQNWFQTFRKFRLLEYERLAMPFPSEHPFGRCFGHRFVILSGSEGTVYIHWFGFTELQQGSSLQLPDA